MFSEESQRTIQQQQQQIQSKSRKKLFVFDKVPESGFILWLFQQYGFLHQLQTVNNAMYHLVSSLLANTLPQWNFHFGFKTLNSSKKCTQKSQSRSSFCYLSDNKVPSQPKVSDYSEKIGNKKNLGSLLALKNVSDVSSAFSQIPHSEKNSQFQKAQKAVNQASSDSHKVQVFNKQKKYVESKKDEVYNSNADFSCVDPLLIFRDLFSPFAIPPPSLYLSIIPEPICQNSNTNHPLALQILNENTNNNNNNMIISVVPPHSEHLFPKSVYSNMIPPLQEYYGRDEKPFPGSIVKPCLKSKRCLPLVFLKSDFVSFSIHSIISSCIAQFREQRLDGYGDNDDEDDDENEEEGVLLVEEEEEEKDENECEVDKCLNTFGQLHPLVQRNLQNPVAKLLTVGDDKHFIPIEDEIIVERCC